MIQEAKLQAQSSGGLIEDEHNFSSESNSRDSLSLKGTEELKLTNPNPDALVSGLRIDPHSSFPSPLSILYDKQRECTDVEVGKPGLTFTSTPIKVNPQKCSATRKRLFQNDHSPDCSPCNSESQEQCEKHTEEDWRGLIKKRKTNSYLQPSIDWKTVDLATTQKTVAIPHIKNGNNPSLKPINFNELSLCFDNTCAFDSIIQILSSAYIDSVEYAVFVQESQLSVTRILDLMAKKQVTHAVYNERAKILFPHFNTTLTFGSAATLKCESTTGLMANVLLHDAPTLSFVSTCGSSQCPQELRTEYNCFVSLDRPVNGLQDLQTSLQSYLAASYTPCNVSIPEATEKSLYCDGIRRTEKSLVSGHLFVEVMDSNPEMIVECRCSLQEVPQKLNLEAKIYLLRGVVAFRGPKRASRKSVGHYTGFVRRHVTDSWQLHDDLKDKVQYVTSNSNVRAHLFIYTI